MRVRIALLVAIGVLTATLAHAQAPAPFADQARKLDGARANLDQLEQTLTRAELPDATLQDLRSTLDPLSASVQSVINELQPKLDAIKARLDQLGPKPQAGATPESAEVAADRDDQQKQFDAIDALLKRASLLGTQIEQDGDTLTQRRREIFTRALFARSQSVLDPRLWISIVQEAPRDARASRIVAGDWLSSAWSKFDRVNGTIAIGGALSLIVAYALLMRLARRVNLRDPAVHDPSPLRMASAAAWGGLCAAAAPILAAFATLGLLRSLDLLGVRLEPLATALFEAVARVALAVAAAHALFAPGLVNWRRIVVSDVIADRLSRLVIVVAGVVSATKVLEAWVEIIGAGLRPSIALRGLGAVAVAAIVGLALRDFGVVEAREEECLPPRVDGGRDWRGPLRTLAWGVVVIVTGAAFAGYNAFASFLVDQALWVAFLAVVIFMAHDLVEEVLAAGARPEAPVGRAMMASVGLGRESLGQIAVLLSGAATLALALAGVTLALAPWGVESDDMFGGVRAAFFGFKVGEVTISLSSVLVALGILALAWALTRALRRWLEIRFLPLTRLDSGLRNSILASIGYIGVISGFALSLGYLGLGFDRLAIVAGALSVGIGFGLQSIVNNFVSGLILLWERAIRVGDWVVLGDEQGYVRRINVRSTEIETFDRATMIVPNSNLVSGVVKNWVRTDRVGRIRCQVSVAPNSDPERVREALLASAAGNDMVQKFPAPVVLFSAMADNVLKFELICFVPDVETSGRVKSDLNFDILRRLREAGIPLFSAPLQVELSGKNGV